KLGLAEKQDEMRQRIAAGRQGKAAPLRPLRLHDQVVADICSSDKQFNWCRVGDKSKVRFNTFIRKTFSIDDGWSCGYLPDAYCVDYDSQTITLLEVENSH